MSTTRRSGIAIWFEEEGDGPPVVLLHGMMGRSGMWRLEGYVDGLRDDHRVILVDARGHGRSERPGDPEAYRLRCHAADVLAVLDELAVEASGVCGWSLGAATALHLAACHPDRVTAVAALGAPLSSVGFRDVPPPVEDEDDEDGWASRFEHDGMAWVVDDAERAGRPAWARLLAKADPLAMAACDRGWSFVEPVPVGIHDLAMPLLFAWGDGELEAGAEELLPRGSRVVVVPGADHLGAVMRADVLLPELRALLAAARPRVAVGAT